MKPFRIAASLALTGLLGISLLLTACNGNSSSTLTGESDTTAQKIPAVTFPEELLTYKVTLVTPDGSPVQDIIIKIQKDGVDKTFKLVGPTGSATFPLLADDYTVLLESPSGKALHFDTEAAVLSPDIPEITLTVHETAATTQPLNAPSKKGDGEYARFEAALVSEGSTFISYNPGDYTYVVFTPTRPGMYEFSCEGEGASLSYHGAPINVFDQPLADTVDGKVSFAITAGSIGNTHDTTAQFVFRVEGSGSGCSFLVTRTGDVPKSPYDEPWTILTAPAEALKPYEGITDGTLTDLDVTNPALTVVLGTDGYYHLDTADGPVVFLRLSSANPYMTDFKTICDTTRICAYLYHEDGSFDRRESYNELILEYLPFANEDGVVPLNEQLAYMVQTAGDYMGWWNFSDNLDIFDDKIVDPEIAWLFACAVYQ